MKPGRRVDRRVLFAVIVILLAGGALLVRASQRSVPGDPLHGFEVGFVEKIEELSIFSDEVRLAYHIERLEERLEELRKASVNPLSAEEYGAVAENVVVHAEKALAGIKASPEPLANTAVLMRLAALLNVYEDVMEGEQVRMIDKANDIVEKEIADQVARYAADREAEELVRTIQAEIAAVRDLTNSGEALAPEVTKRLEEALDHVRSGELEGALQSVLEAQVEALTQEYLQTSSEVEE